MFLIEEQVKKFQQLYREEFNEELSYEIAYDKGVKLVRLMEIILKQSRKGNKKIIKLSSK